MATHPNNFWRDVPVGGGKLWRTTIVSRGAGRFTYTIAMPRGELDRSPKSYFGADAAKAAALDRIAALMTGVR